jgi:ParB family chromosome partitioning protein
MKRNALGKGIAAIISNQALDQNKLVDLPVENIYPNPFQPRMKPDQDLEELAASIRENGVIQPIVVRKRPDGFELIVGERRLRAAKLAGLTRIPSVVKDVSQPQMLELALIENIQRSDLDPIEAALAYKRLADEFNLKHEEIADKVGKSRSTVTNALRLLQLPQKVRDALSAHQISEGHARALLVITNRQSQEDLCARIVAEGFLVRTVERMLGAKPKKDKAPRPRADPNLAALEEQLQQRLGTRVHIRQKEDQGEIVVGFGSAEERERLVRIILTGTANARK